MAHDVFVSYSAKDKAFADGLCAALENKRIRCWVAPRDVLPGKNYAEALIEALNNSKIMVLVFSSNSNNSLHVAREVERAVNKGIPIIPIRIENVIPTKSMEYFLSVPQWLDAFTPPLEEHLQKLTDTVQALLGGYDEKQPEAKPKDVHTKAALEGSVPTKVSHPDESQVSCTGCGKTMPTSLEYCSNCGKKLTKAALEGSVPTKVSHPDESARYIR